MYKLEVFLNPCNKVVLVRPLDGLVEEVWREEFINICAREFGGEWLGSTVNGHSGQVATKDIPKNWGQFRGQTTVCLHLVSQGGSGIWRVCEVQQVSHQGPWGRHHT